MLFFNFLGYGGRGKLLSLNESSGFSFAFVNELVRGIDI